MKKIILGSLITTTSICMLLIAFLYADNKISVVDTGDRAWVIPYSNVEELEKDVDLIIEGVVTSNTHPRIIDGSQVFPEFNYKTMQTDVKVQSVLKSNGKVEHGQTIKILEPTFIVDNGLFTPGKTEYSGTDYRKALSGKQYLLFLVWNEQLQAYWVHASHQGKFNLDGSDQREQEIANTNQDYKNLKNSVLSKYKL